MTYPTPTEPGWYFARYVLWSNVEPVELIEARDGLRVLIAGQSDMQEPIDFTWGPRITMPEDLAVEEAGR